MSRPLHIARAGDHRFEKDEDPDPQYHREQIGPWLSALFQAEHLNLLVGSGFTIALARAADVSPVDMRVVEIGSEHADRVAQSAAASAKHLGRDEPNIEDQTRAILELIGGLNVFASASDQNGEPDATSQSAARLLTIWRSELDKTLSSFLQGILETERGIHSILVAADDDKAARLRHLLAGFLLPFGSRTATRERTHIFTLNYDRLIEYGCDLLGLRMVDRFVGTLAPVFHSSRLGVDLHYNPPGIRGEPRYLEGVVRFTKLHGSIDWQCEGGPSGSLEVQRRAVPFGAPNDHQELPSKPGQQLLIYPNAAKDIETLEFPYAELFRDFAAATCQPNAVVVTYGYGFGDDHVNRVLRDMLSIPSTHLVIISFDDASGRLPAFCETIGHEAQITLLVGPHFAELGTLVEYYLPKPAIDRTTSRMVELLRKHTRPVDPTQTAQSDQVAGGNDPE